MRYLTSCINLSNISGTHKSLLITVKRPGLEDKSYSISSEFIEWFVGFVDAEGNFNIRLTNPSDKTFKHVQFTFQIGLHKDEIKVLEYIMNTLKCGHISKSNDRINFFVNDINSLLYVIIPIFNYFNLNSSKYHHFVLFKNSVSLTKDKSHLTEKGKLDIIRYRNEMQSMTGKWVPSSINNKIKITKHWLAGFIDGEATFSTNKYKPRFKLENHIKELELYNKIIAFINVGKVVFTAATPPPRENRVNSSPTIVLEINDVRELKKTLIPLIYHNDSVLLNTLKVKDFYLWLKLVDIYYKGYHTTLQGKYIFDSIKLHMNKYRLTTNINLLNNKEQISISEIENLLSRLYLSESPYEIKEGVRYIRNTDKLVRGASNKIVVIDSDKKTTVYNSLTECAKSLNIPKDKIKQCLNRGKSLNGHSFVLS